MRSRKELSVLDPSGGFWFVSVKKTFRLIKITADGFVGHCWLQLLLGSVVSVKRLSVRLQSLRADAPGDGHHAG